FFAGAEAALHDGAFALLLDGKSARTPAGRPLAHGSARLMALVAGEWNALVGAVDPALLPVTRILNSAIDGVAAAMAPTRAAIAEYSGADLLCYRAERPATLAAEQAAAFDPPLKWARDALGADLRVGEGIVHVAQAGKALAALRGAVDAFDDPAALAALHVAVTLTGSLVLGLALARGAFSPDAILAAAETDEAYQARHWGADEEAQARRAARAGEFRAAAATLAALGGGGDA
ncbi:MAG: ATPase, partial [Hyphomicrobiales bacterium]|nr:ATPase [Hyphomicrobiales bacterium]